MATYSAFPMTPGTRVTVLELGYTGRLLKVARVQVVNPDSTVAALSGLHSLANVAGGPVTGWTAAQWLQPVP